MPIKAIVESVDDLPEAVRDFYKQEGDNFILQVDGIKEHPDVLSLKNAHDRQKQTNKALTTERDALKARVTGLPDDFDASAYESLREAAEGKGGTPTEEQLQAARDKIKKALETAHGSEVAKLNDRIGKLDGALRKLTIDRAIKDAMGEAKIADEHRDILLPHLKQTFKIDVEEDDDGNFVARVDTDMGPVPIMKAVTDWAGTEKGKVYVAKSTGPDARGGRGGGANGAKTKTRAEFDAMSHHERATFAKEGGKVVDVA